MNSSKMETVFERVDETTSTIDTIASQIEDVVKDARSINESVHTFVEDSTAVASLSGGQVDAIQSISGLAGELAEFAVELRDLIRNT
ncbi:MAG: hypothetical protein GX316_08145 [Firmicutes bacterium]|nr:hypothetical protein [Bacillota bacterium]